MYQLVSLESGKSDLFSHPRLAILVTIAKVVRGSCSVVCDLGLFVGGTNWALVVGDLF